MTSRPRAASLAVGLFFYGLLLLSLRWAAVSRYAAAPIRVDRDGARKTSMYGTCREPNKGSSGRLRAERSGLATGPLRLCPVQEGLHPRSGGFFLAAFGAVLLFAVVLHMLARRRSGRGDAGASAYALAVAGAALTAGIRAAMRPPRSCSAFSPWAGRHC